MKETLAFFMLIAVPIFCAVIGAAIPYLLGPEAVEYDAKEIGRYAGMAIGIASAITPMGWLEYYFVYKPFIFVYAVALYLAMLFTQFLVSCAFGAC